MAPQSGGWVATNTPPTIDPVTARYLVVWSLHWDVIECQRLEPRSDLSAAMEKAIERLRGAGWQAEDSADFGFVFIRQGVARRLLAITERDPHSEARQSFSPFG